MVETYPGQVFGIRYRLEELLAIPETHHMSRQVARDSFDGNKADLREPSHRKSLWRPALNRGFVESVFSHDRTLSVR